MLGLVPARHHEFVNQKLEAVELVNSLDEEQKRAAEEGLSEDELALFDLLQKDSLGKAERERVKQASQELLASLQELVAGLDRFWEKEQTQAEVEVFILDRLFEALPTPPFTEEEKEEAARKVYQHVWQQAASGMFSEAA
jgi:type I restriction enzyme R subunit